ncbi:hypothetical protein [Novosphingobium sp.]|uniref:hypothetical protein n=1 Tax=Novosphingobium sp. TaxID=1874826 RepID=UPI003B522431
MDFAATTWNLGEGDLLSIIRGDKPEIKVMKNPKLFAAALTVSAAFTAIPCVAFAQETQPASTAAQAAQMAPAQQAIAPKAGDTIFDNTGASIGPVDSVSDQQFVVSSAAGKATLKVDSLAMGTNGLMINMTKAQFEAAVAAAHGAKAN